jgi:hypothetical protein
MPTQQSREDGDVLGLEAVATGLEDVRNLAVADQQRRLSGSNDQCCAVLDLIVKTRKALDHGVLAVVHPLDNVYEFCPQFVHDAHCGLPY